MSPHASADLFVSVEAQQLQGFAGRGAMRAQTVHTEQGVVRVVGAGAVVPGQLPYVLRPAVAHGCH
jgi:hypothetical protein